VRTSDVIVLLLVMAGFGGLILYQHYRLCLVESELQRLKEKKEFILPFPKPDNKPMWV